MNLITVICLIALALWLALALRAARRQSRGCGSCHGCDFSSNCRHCPAGQEPAPQGKDSL